MKYGEFEDWVQKNCMYETFYVDSEGRSILVIRQLDAWVMCNKFPKQWVGLTDDDVYLLETLHAPPIHPDFVGGDDWGEFVRAIEAKLKEKNGK